MTLIRSQYALEDLPERAAIINVTAEVTAQKSADGWQVPGTVGAYRSDDLMSSYPGPWLLIYKGPVPPAYPDPTPAQPIIMNIDGPREPRPAYCRCDFR